MHILPLHLRSKTLDRKEKNKRTDVRSSKNTAHSGKAKKDIRPLKKHELDVKSTLRPDSFNRFTAPHEFKPVAVPTISGLWIYKGAESYNSHEQFNNIPIM